MVLTYLSILDVNYISNLLGVDVNGRCCFIFGALYNSSNFIGSTQNRLNGLGQTFVRKDMVRKIEVEFQH